VILRVGDYSSDNSEKKDMEGEEQREEELINIPLRSTLHQGDGT